MSVLIELNETFFFKFIDNRLQMYLEIEFCWKGVSCSLISEEHFLQGSLFGHQSNEPNLSFKQLNVYLGQVAWLYVTLWNHSFPETIASNLKMFFADLDFWLKTVIRVSAKSYISVHTHIFITKGRQSVFNIQVKDAAFRLMTLLTDQ